jgi:hypothetical protein
MDIGFEIETLHRECAGEQPASRRSVAPEWTALRDRLNAGWAARRALLARLDPCAPRTGSFNRPSARALAAQANGADEQASSSVNLTLSANCKPGDGMEVPPAGSLLAGDRGQ